jgi:predicted glycoside hydrolase/deacetylase ChbG (UPF0249 family)
MLKSLIINADDFGLCFCVNSGIEKAHRGGVLSSASLLCNTSGFAEAVEISRRNPGLGVGVHLNILRGRPVSTSEKIYPLLNSKRQFKLSASSLWRTSVTRNLANIMEIEYRAQIEKALDAGVKPTHLDSEKHHMLWRTLSKLMKKLAADYQIPAVRNLREPVAFALKNLPWPGAKNAWNAAKLRTIATLTTAKGKCATPDYFFGQTHIGKISTAFLLELLKNLPTGISELMCHPGECDQAEMKAVEEETGESWINDCRAAELAALTAPEVKTALRDNGVELVNYGVFSPRFS